ncbi:hypothetical protein ACWEWU_14530 [Staphylococcus xylosus]
MKPKKVIIVTVTTSLLLATFTPFIEASESINETNANSESTQLINEQPKEVTSYQEFVSSNEPVVIDPTLLTESQLRQQGVSERDIREIHQSKLEYEDRAPQYGKVYGKKSWSQSISKNQISGRAASIAGALNILSRVIKHPVVKISRDSFTIIAGVSTYKKYRGVKIGGTAYKKLYRKNHYQTPKLQWLYYVNWAKRY